MAAATKTTFWTFKQNWRELPIWVILRLDRMQVPNWRNDFLRIEYDIVSDAYWVFLGSYVAKLHKD